MNVGTNKIVNSFSLIYKVKIENWGLDNKTFVKSQDPFFLLGLLIRISPGPLLLALDINKLLHIASDHGDLQISRQCCTGYGDSVLIITTSLCIETEVLY